VLAASLAAAVPALPASGADYPGVPTSPGPWTPTDPVGPDGFRHPTAATRIWRAESPSVVRIGTSVRGRAIVARRQGPADAPYALLVLGQMHGSEPAGRRVVERVRALRAPGSVQVWTISTMNPDGSVAGTLTGWYNTTYAGFAVTVELPAAVPDAAARRYARAALSVGGRIPTG